MKPITKECSVVMLPTDKPNPNLFIHQGLGCKEKILSTGQGIVHHKEMMECGVSKPQHLYFTTDEKIKKGEWMYYNVDGSKGIRVSIDNTNDPMYKKIIATTYKSLWYTSEMTERGKFEKNMLDNANNPFPRIEDARNMSWFKASSVNRIPESFIEEYVNKQGKIDKVRIEYTKTIVIDTLGSGIFEQLKLTSNGEVIIHPFEEKMYSREEVRGILKMCNKDLRLLNLDKIILWFDKNLS